MCYKYVYICRCCRQETYHAWGFCNRVSRDHRRTPCKVPIIVGLGHPREACQNVNCQTIPPTTPLNPTKLSLMLENLNQGGDGSSGNLWNCQLFPELTGWSPETVQPRNYTPEQWTKIGDHLSGLHKAPLSPRTCVDAQLLYFVPTFIEPQPGKNVNLGSPSSNPLHPDKTPPPGMPRLPEDVGCLQRREHLVKLRQILPETQEEIQAPAEKPIEVALRGTVRPGYKDSNGFSQPASHASTPVQKAFVANNLGALEHTSDTPNTANKVSSAHSGLTPAQSDQESGAVQCLSRPASLPIKPLPNSAAQSLSLPSNLPISPPPGFETPPRPRRTRARYSRPRSGPETPSSLPGNHNNFFNSTLTQEVPEGFDKVTLAAAAEVVFTERRAEFEKLHGYELERAHIAARDEAIACYHEHRRTSEGMSVIYARRKQQKQLDDASTSGSPKKTEKSPAQTFPRSADAPSNPMLGELPNSGGVQKIVFGDMPLAPASAADFSTGSPTKKTGIARKTTINTTSQASPAESLASLSCSPQLSAAAPAFVPRKKTSPSRVKSFTPFETIHESPQEYQYGSLPVSGSIPTGPALSWDPRAGTFVNNGIPSGPINMQAMFPSGFNTYLHAPSQATTALGQTPSPMPIQHRPTYSTPPRQPSFYQHFGQPFGSVAPHFTNHQQHFGQPQPFSQSGPDRMMPPGVQQHMNRVPPMTGQPEFSQPRFPSLVLDQARRELVLKARTMAIERANKQALKNSVADENSKIALFATAAEAAKFTAAAASNAMQVVIRGAPGYPGGSSSVPLNKSAAERMAVASILQGALSSDQARAMAKIVAKGTPTTSAPMQIPLGPLALNAKSRHASRSLEYQLAEQRAGAVVTEKARSDAAAAEIQKHKTDEAHMRKLEEEQRQQQRQQPWAASSQSPVRLNPHQIIAANEESEAVHSKRSTLGYQRALNARLVDYLGQEPLLLADNRKIPLPPKVSSLDNEDTEQWPALEVAAGKK